MMYMNTTTPTPPPVETPAKKSWYTKKEKPLVSIPRQECLIYKEKFVATKTMLATLGGMTYVSILNHTDSGKVTHYEVAGGETLWDVESWENYKNTLQGSGRKQNKNKNK